MCRNIKQLRHPEQAPTDEEIRDAALQFVRKVSVGCLFDILGVLFRDQRTPMFICQIRFRDFTTLANSLILSARLALPRLMRIL